MYAYAKKDIDLTVTNGSVFKKGELYGYSYFQDIVIVKNGDKKIPFSKKLFEEDFDSVL